MARTDMEKARLKQIWLDEEDQHHLNTVIKQLESEGIKVRRNGKLSLTAIVRVLLARAAKGANNATHTD